MLSQQLLDILRRRGLTDEELAAVARQVTQKQQNPYALVPRMVEQLLEGAEHGKN
jgi:hypothetical protein